MAETKKLDVNELEQPIPGRALQIQESVSDIRDWLGPLILFTLLSPLCRCWLSWTTSLLVVTTYYGLPPLIRRRYPTFMKPNIFDDIRIDGGAALSLLGSVTALILQVSSSLFIQQQDALLNRETYIVP